jgi:hypothetical protein
MALPTYLVEIQFGSSGYVDVSAYVKSISFSRGISRALDDYSAGTISITFVNNARIFDPLNTSSILYYSAGGYTMVQPGGKIRVTANTTTRVFTGFIQTWDFSYDEAGLDGQATVTALDVLFKASNYTFAGGTQGVVEPTSNRMKRVLGSFLWSAADYAGIQAGITMVGADTQDSGNNVLSYLQNLARSEPGDFYSDSSAIYTFKDRSFINYTYTNVVRQNLISPPSTATASTATGTAIPTGWVYGTATTIDPSAPYQSGTANVAQVVTANNATEMLFNEVNALKYNPDQASAGTVVATAYVYGLQASDMTMRLTLVNAANTGAIGSAATTITFAGGWEKISATAVYGDVSYSGLKLRLYGTGTALVGFYANGIIAENIAQGASAGAYFDGASSPGITSATTRYEVAWLGSPGKSSSGLVTSTASTATAPTLVTFADQNSQGALYGNGTGIPFTNLQITYASDQMYNNVQVVGVNATATASDTALISRYGNFSWSQTDNLTTSVTRPAVLATSYLAEFRLPEYRASAITVALHALTTAQQNLLLALELRDVVRVCFQPSATGSVIAKYYQILGMDCNADPERVEYTYKLASLDRLGMRLDSPYLAILDTSILG